jgi:O-antigen ligase
MFAAHPILGVGLGGYWIGITAFHDASGLMTPQEAHNDYLELLSSGGIIGFAIGVWFVIAFVRATRRNLWAEDMRTVRFGAILGITGVAAHSLVDFGLHILVNAIVFLALISIATRENSDPCPLR